MMLEFDENGMCCRCRCMFFFQAEDGIRDLVRSRGLGDVYKRQVVSTAWGSSTGQSSLKIANDRGESFVYEGLHHTLSLIHI